MYNILSRIDSPEAVKALNADELNLLAVDIRQFLIENVSKTGGHLASNLGAVELTIALHYVFDSPEDKLIWDVGHQAYVHKILTGRKDCFGTLRQWEGMSGFLKRKESIHDCFEAGHSSTSISAAVGMALARDLNRRQYEVVPIIGDGALTGGMALEALNYLGHCQSNVKVILNDNEMSISENVGGISQALSRLRATEAYNKLKDETKSTLARIPNIGESMIDVIGRLKDSFKYFVVDGGLFFEEIGLTYFGPINGHNITELIKNLEMVKQIKGPVVLHVLTQKGKGYSFSEQNPNKYHGVGKFDPKVDLPVKRKNDYATVFGETLTALAKTRGDIVAVSAAMIDGTGLCSFKSAYPDRIFDVGIAEQHAVTMSAGLACQGMKPFVAIYSTFLQRAYDQIFHDVCLQNYPVVFCIDRAGLVGNDGETHHGVFDIAYLSHLPNMRIFAPKDQGELEAMLAYAAEDLDGPISIRYPRGTAEKMPPTHSPTFTPERMLKGRKTIVVSTGKMTGIALEAIEKCETGKIGLIHVPRIKPLHEAELLTELSQASRIVTIEDHAVIGGFGDQINRLIMNHPAAFKQMPEVYNLGYRDQFVTQGDVDTLMDEMGLSSEKICKFLREVQNG
ncbi:1-deoxy-D-xylulose-5-phosphate synthase [Fusibacter paucivorans]|uniref:1-deoxy-D-xylulose-5-phosphate synthase n=1 Tax=Fusibacter paucivorans TaxID=76009 RepID=A0ABS5PNQ2_9FIRM|nr:1-deoxy-D-xylulose-5-phosphate synthase [Fusibacter paucivorans]MBS7526698.1 1-deoxy-D-xylulose-5-phosphate synthase [Fusibacter paucivorans]